MPTDQEEQEKFQRAVESQEIPHLYCNGFANGLSQGDVTTVLYRSGVAVATLNLPFTIAKTFALKLGQIVNDLETRSGQTIMTTDEVQVFMEGPKKK